MVCGLSSGGSAQLPQPVVGLVPNLKLDFVHQNSTSAILDPIPGQRSELYNALKCSQAYVPVLSSLGSATGRLKPPRRVP